MAKDFAKAFYNSDGWDAIRRSYIGDRTLKDGGMCELCHERPGYIVHHVIWLTPSNIHDPNITMNKDNLQYVCKQCHDKIHFIADMDTRCIVTGKQIGRAHV